MNTNQNLFDDYNNLVIIQDKSVARAFKMEFEEMWGGTGLNYDFNNSKFGPNKSDNTPHEFIVGGNRFELYFSPTDNVTSKIIKVIESTDYQLSFSLLSFTRDDIANSIISINDNFGVQVRGLIENISDVSGEFPNLQSAGVNVQSHQSFSDVLHHKYCIVDQNIGLADPLVLTGSHNWSTSAEDRNDENTVIIHSQNIANQFYQEFIARWQEVVGIIETNNSMNLFLYPNPSVNGSFNLEFSSKYNDKEIFSCFDMLGKEVYRKNLHINSGENKIKIDTNLKPGLYLIKLGNDFSKLVVK